MRSHYTIVLSFLIFGLSSNIAAEQMLKQIQAASDPWPPYIDETHPEGGVSVQLANAALKTQGYVLINKIMPWARAIEETKKGRNDVILDTWWTQERSTYFLYSRPYLDGPVKFIKRKGDAFVFKRFRDLSGKTIGLVRDYAYSEELLKARNYTPFDVTDFLQSVEMLVKGRTDLAIENELVARTRIRQVRPDLEPLIEFADDELSNNYVYVVSGYENPRHVEIIAAFNRGLDIILKNGTYARILQENGLTVPKMFQSM